MSRCFLGVVTAAALLVSGVGHAADLEAAKKKVSEICQACHGMDGNSQVPDYPKLAVWPGSNAVLLVSIALSSVKPLTELSQ